MPLPILNTPTPDQIKLEVLRQHFPQAIETDADGRIRINANALHLYAAANVVFVVQAVPLDLLTDTLRAMQQQAAPPVYLTVYAPWIADSNFMLGIKTMAETLGFSDDKLRLRG